jgi:Asp-tRNA(Asn)/Glu-tRNA(Gln) amidotransferase A subunit family amidase
MARSPRYGAGGMTLAEVQRMIRAAIRAARQEGVQVVEVDFGDEATVRIPIAPHDTPVAESPEIVL